MRQSGKVFFVVCGLALSFWSAEGVQAVEVIDVSMEVCDVSGELIDPERFGRWNRQPDCGDVLLPMPCGEAMVMRRVSTPTSSNWMDDIQVRVGEPGAQVPYSDASRSAQVAGSLTDTGDPEARYFLIGKFELTERQYALVGAKLSSEDCKTMSDISDSRPYESLSWFAAVQFARHYSSWLLEHAAPLLPVIDGEAVPFVRLPTEAEWEYAARGGNAVDTEERRSRLFPMDDVPAEYIWYSSSDSCSGKVRPIGGLSPNPLGLHDILGNVQEIVLEPFSLNGDSTLHGQQGGYVTKGGSCRTPIDQLFTGMRREQPFFNGNSMGEFKPLATGARFVLSAPIQTSQQRISELKEDWQKMQATRTTTDPAGDLITLSKTVEEASVKNTITTAAEQVTAELIRRKRIESRSIQTAITSGASHIRILRRDYTELSAFRTGCREYPGSKVCDGVADRLARFEFTRRIYSEILAQTADDFESDELATQLPAVVGRFENTGTRMGLFSGLFVSQAELYKQQAPDNLDRYIDEILAVPPADVEGR